MNYAPGYVAHYWGNFTINNGQVVGGSIDVYEEVFNGQRVFALMDSNAPAASALQAVIRHDGAANLGVLFAGNDEITGSSKSDFLLGMDGNDTVRGAGGDDDVNGNVGADMVYGGDGADWVRGGKDNDTVNGDAGNDPHVNGNLGNDMVYGGAGDDTVFGGQGNDTVDGGTGDDSVSGDLGNDWLLGGLGTDLLRGGAGADFFLLPTGHGVDGIVDFNFAEGDRIVLARGTTWTQSSDSVGVFIDINNPTDGLLLFDVHETVQESWFIYV